MNNMFNQVDLCFVIDTTGSMGGFIEAARREMRDMLQALAQNPSLPLDLRVSVVEYRDHPPQEQSYVYRLHQFTSNLEQVHQVINGLKPDGGGDAPESVYDGLMAARKELNWRQHSRRIIALIGDAPPHNQKTRPEADLALFGDCTCGLSLDEVSAAIECAGITLYTVDLTGSAEPGFAALARMCGGKYFPAGQGQHSAIETLRALLQKDFGELDFDRAVLESWNAVADASIDKVSETLQAGTGRVARSLERLARRGLLNLRSEPHAD